MFGVDVRNGKKGEKIKIEKKREKNLVCLLEKKMEGRKGGGELRV